jgi:hypothetical protein
VRKSVLVRKLPIQRYPKDCDRRPEHMPENFQFSACQKSSIFQHTVCEVEKPSKASHKHLFSSVFGAGLPSEHLNITSGFR